MSGTKIIDEIKINNTTASILGAKYNETNGGIAFQSAYANGAEAFAVGQSTADGVNAFAEGLDTEATGYSSHAEGNTTVAEGNSSHSEGNNTYALGDDSHAEGCGGVAQGIYSHVEGYSSQEKDEKGNYKYGALGEASHAEGKNTKASGKYSHAEGDTTFATGEASHAEGYDTRAEGQYSHAEGNSAKAIGQSAHAEGEGTEASGWTSHAEGFETHTFGGSSHAEGQDTIASGHRSHAEGDASEAIGEASHTEGNCTKAFGKYSHAEGDNTISGGNSSHTEGYQTKTATEFSYEFFEVNNIIRPDDEDYQGDYYLDLQLDSIEGLEINFEIIFDTDDQDIDMCYSIISNINHVDKIITLHAIDQDGYILAEADFSALKRKYFYIYDNPELGSVARNGASYAHAEGNSTKALGEASHAEGKDTKATGNYSHAGGIGTIASAEAQTAIGKYNQVDSDALFIVGDGSASTPSNAFVVKTDGTVWAGNKELTADTVVDNTIQDFKVSDDFIDNNNNITRDNTTTFSYSYQKNGVANYQYLNPPLRDFLDATKIDSGKAMSTTNGYITSKEYPTTERWMGFPVYQVVIKLKGSIDYIDIPWDSQGTQNFTAIDSIGLLCYQSGNTATTRNMPYGYAHIWGETGIKNGHLRIRKNSTSSLSDSYTIFFTVKYIKESLASILKLS